MELFQCGQVELYQTAREQQVLGRRKEAGANIAELRHICREAGLMKEDNLQTPA